VTVADALSAIRRVGEVENCAGNLRLRFPEAVASEIQPAIAVLRTGKVEALALLADPDAAELTRACSVLNRSGVRIMTLEAGATIGVWSDLDGPEVRQIRLQFPEQRERATRLLEEWQKKARKSGASARVSTEYSKFVRFTDPLWFYDSFANFIASLEPPSLPIAARKTHPGILVAAI
jgi:hypothetical protein